ncbi:Rrf2 family protein [Allocatelliglobosispora scoriae]|uniref:Rrf2 family protein n=1 Tax=Allocatelliglobosispora scoriae TaxID=643052 RepID=A0A841BPR2_9ACTN|nr:Rrf2 family transcriptional regulator [Allocatelliglobosispora scoriae]MBB5868821.1 Rrf2 family protein [Allocatelliglobosispora scoriae]
MIRQVGPIPVRTDYAVRALATLAAHAPASVKAQLLAETHHIPLSYLYDVLSDLRRSELVHSQRGTDGGFTLTRAPSEITLGDVVRALDGAPGSGPPLRQRNESPDGLALRLQELWTAADTATMRVWDGVTLADLTGDRG